MSERLLKRNNSGSVYSLRPDLPIDCFTSCSILEASKIMTENRVHCIIIKDLQTKRIRGLVTAKDLAFRVVAMNVSEVAELTVDTIMTINPYVSSINTSANDALRLMVEKRIRHLPLIDDNSGIVKGILNITKCFYHAMIRLEKMSLEAEKLQNTFEDLQNVVDNFKNSSGSRKNSYTLINRDDNGQLIEQSIINNPTSQLMEPLISDDQDTLIDFSILEKKKKIVNDLRRLIDLMTQPDLKSILRDPDLTINRPIFISSRSSVLDAAKLLKFRNLTAVLISDEIDYDIDDYNKDKVIGILTTKDIAFRVLALNIDPETTSVARVMTPKPNFANENLTIHKALRMMYEGKFLNLPIMNNETNEITGIVSVLQLTYSLLKILDGNSPFTYNVTNNSSTMINSNPDDFLFEEDEAPYGSFSGNNNSNGDSRFREGPAWKQFWGSLDQPLSTVESNEKLTLNSRALSITRSSISSVDHSHNSPNLQSFQQRPKSFSYQTAPRFNNSQIDEEAIEDDGSAVLINNSGSMLRHDNNKESSSLSRELPSPTTFSHSGRNNNGKNTNTMFSSGLDNTAAYTKSPSLDMGSSGQMDLILLKIKIRSNLLDFNNKIFKMKINLTNHNPQNKFKGVLGKVQSEVMKKLSVPDTKKNTDKFKMDMSYIDEEHDVITIEKDEDLENAMDSVTNIQHKRYLSISMKIYKETDSRSGYNKSKQLIDIPNDNNSSADYDYEGYNRYIGFLNSAILTSSLILLGIYIVQKTYKNS